MVILSPRQWESLWDWMGKPEAFGDLEYWSQVGNRIMNADVLNPAYSEFTTTRTCWIFVWRGRRGIVVTPLLKQGNSFRSHLLARGTFVHMR